VNTLPDGAAPVIKSFSADPSSISEGGTSSLSWNVKGATIYIIDQGIGIPTAKYSQPVSPAKTTTYALTAINSYGTDNATVTVTVNP
jgi:PKD repeat protein